ncbi:MAG TPA: hypothetical protein DCP90_08705 [Clostridiales bacterium]|nr:MAG: hypothetical protein A2Y22_05725 [Clostridiales bacterium GWD2_32_59]HAN10674.1 hypothetical protein [Clostridiales bacterium]
MVNILLNQALKEVEKLNKGEVFLVKDLFKGYEWNRIPKEDRLLLGRLFLNEMEKEHVTEIQILDKTSSKQQKYSRV